MASKEALAAGARLYRKKRVVLGLVENLPNSTAIWAAVRQTVRAAIQVGEVRERSRGKR